MWRLIGVKADGTLCHKPCTVSGGGKSEISKSIANVILQGPVFVRDYHAEMEAAASIIAKDFSSIYRDRPPDARTRRPILSPERSLGSVIKLLTPSSDYNDEYNQWLQQIPQTVRQLVFTIKRYYRPDWEDGWRTHLTVDRVNGRLGHELKYNDQKLVGNYLRVGYDPDGSWRIFKLRPDFHPAEKVQMEDDITASVVLPAESLSDLGPRSAGSVKLVANCETMLFQRPDDAIHRGLDQQAESDLAAQDVFLSNFQPLTRSEARAIADHVVEFDKYTKPMQERLSEVLLRPEPDFVVSSAHPRVVDGKPSKNPRYLQRRRDLANAQATYIAQVCMRLQTTYCTFRWTRCSRRGAIIRRIQRSASRHWRCTTPFTGRSCRNSSWITFRA
jgi:hypothetical protein